MEEKRDRPPKRQGRGKSTPRTDDDLAEIRAAAIADAEADPWPRELTDEVLATVRGLRRRRALQRAQDDPA